MKFKYVGNGERVFPSLGKTVKPNEEFDAPDNFSATDVISVGAKSVTKETKPTEIIKSAATDENVGE